MEVCTACLYTARQSVRPTPSVCHVTCISCAGQAKESAPAHLRCSPSDMAPTSPR